jgi:hypothetical protein
MKKVKTPQQKKDESLRHDRRNAYGENDKSSRKSIRRRKRQPNRSNRRAGSAILEAAAGPADGIHLEAVQSKLEGKRPKTWSKSPDVPLAQWIEGRLRRKQLNQDGAQKKRNAPRERGKT